MRIAIQHTIEKGYSHQQQPLATMERESLAGKGGEEWSFENIVFGTYLKAPIPPGSINIAKGVARGRFSHRFVNARRMRPWAT